MNENYLFYGRIGIGGFFGEEIHLRRWDWIRRTCRSHGNRSDSRQRGASFFQQAQDWNG